MGTLLLPDLTEDRICGYIATRLDEKACGRPINMEVGELSRAIGKKWSTLWPGVRKLEERKDVGKALSPEEEFACSQPQLRLRCTSWGRSSESRCSPECVLVRSSG